jgi:uncharacterized repeat protein (TIGR01451 family)
MLPAGTYPLTALAFTHPFLGNVGLPGITTDVIIQGAGSDSTIIKRSDAAIAQFRLMAVSNQTGGSIVLNDLTMRGGRIAGQGGDGQGGALYTWGRAATLNRVVFDDNRATSGGAVVTSDQGGVLVANDCIFTNNQATGGSGGAIISAQMTILGSTFTDNSAVYGGALYFIQGGGANFNIADSTFTGNQAAGIGGAIYVAGVATIQGSLFNSNSAGSSGSSGGALSCNGCTLNLSDCVVTGNQATSGGGLHLSNSSFNISRSTISNNNASTHFGGGIYVDTGGGTVSASTINGNSSGIDGGGLWISNINLTLANVTVDGNTSGQYGAGIYYQAFTAKTLALNNVTLTGNHAASLGGGLFRYDYDGSVDAKNSIIALNSSGINTAPDIFSRASSFTSLGYNLIGIKDENYANFTNATGDQTGTTANPINPLLGPLQDNGGPTATRVPLTSSLVLDAGNPSAPGTGGTTCEATDQRSVPRPQSGDGVGGARCDKGAVERTAGQIEFSSATYSVDEGGGMLTVSVRPGISDFGSISVGYATSDGTAQAGLDYVATSGTLVFDDPIIANKANTPNSSTKTFTVPILEDALDEPDETFNLILTNPTGGASLGQINTAITTILDNDLPGVSIADASANEGNSGTTTATFNVSLTLPSNQTVTVNYGTSDGSASSSSDYFVTSGQLVFAPGETCKTIDVPVQGDTVREPAETFLVDLTGVTNGVLADSQATGTILNDDFLYDLKLSLFDSPDPVNVGDELTYNINVFNEIDSVTGVVLTDTLPANVTFISATPNQGSCELKGGQVICAFGSIAEEDSALVSIVVRADVVGTLINSASVTSNEPDMNPTDNLASLTTTVRAVAELAIAEPINQRQVLVGSRSAYRYIISNNGPNEARHVTLTFVVPAGTTFSDASTGCVESSGNIICSSKNPLQPNQSLQWSVILIPNQVGPINTSATVTSDEFDTDITNNTASFEGMVSPAADLSVTSSVTPNPSQQHQSVQFKLNYKNQGPSSATDAVLRFTLPSGFTYVSAPAGCVLAAPSTTCSLGNLPVGDAGQISIDALAENIGTFFGSASITSGVADPRRNNNSTSVYSTVNDPAQPVDLAVTLHSNTLIQELQPADVQIEVTNHGPVIAPNVVLRITLPGDIDYVSSTGGALEGGIVTFNLGNLAVAETRHVSITVTASGVVSTANPAPLFEVAANAISDNQDTDSDNNTKTAFYSVQAHTADLRVRSNTAVITHDVIVTNPAGGGTFATHDWTTTIVVDNRGPSSVGNVVIRDLGEGVATHAYFERAGSSDQVPCSSSGFLVNCNVGTLSADPTNNANTVTVIITSGGGTEIMSLATVSGSLFDQRPLNNSMVTSAGNNLGGAEGVETPTGTNVTVETGPATITYGGVGVAGTTTVTPLNGGGDIGTLPSAFSIAGAGIAFDISTTATISPPIDLCFRVPSVSDETAFSRLRVMHNEGGTLVDRTTSTDFPTRKICARTSSLSPFAIAQAIDNSLPTITGHVADGNGVSLAGVNVGLSSSQNISTTTDADGNYTFVNLQAGENYTVIPFSVNYDFAPSGATINNLSGNQIANFTGANAPPPNVVQFSQPTFTAAEDGNHVTLNLARSGNLTLEESVKFSTSEFSAVAGKDYVDSTGLITFAPGESSKSFDILLTDDSLNETDETFNVTLSQLYRLKTGLNSTATVTITDGDPPPALALAGTSLLETNSGTFAAFTLAVSGSSDQPVSVAYSTSDGTATQGSDYTSANGVISFAPGETSKTITVPVIGDVVTELAETFFLNLQSPVGATISNGQATATILNDDNSPTAAPASISGSISKPDGSPLGGVVITLAGNSERRTITDEQGRYAFNEVETGGFYTVSPARAGYVFAPAELSFSLLANKTDAVFIALMAPEDTANTLDTAEFFVRQHYLDFLGREPDAAGLAFWTNQIAECESRLAAERPSCREVRRVNVSAAFFLSIEYQQTGFFATRVQRTAFGRRSKEAASRLSYQQFTRDARVVAAGVVVGQPGFEQRLEANKQNYLEQIVNSPQFMARFPVTQNAGEFVAALYSSAGVTPSPGETQAALADFGGGGTAGRVAALRTIAESASITNAEFNAAFVLMQYHGYLRRNPTDAPDTDDAGYQFWLAKLNQFNSNFVEAEMVKAFINSGEYHHRFGL